MSIRVAVDGMGGDHAPDVVVEGAVRAAARRDDMRILLVGQTDVLSARLEALGAEDTRIDVIEAPEVIGMAESPSTAVKRKTSSSIHVGLSLHRAGDADSFVSAGNTGAVMAASLFILGRLPGVSRPAILSPYPTLKGHCGVVDVGANVDCRPDHLVQFGAMAAVYVQRIWDRQNPTVGLLNIGEEPSKGNELSKEAYALMQQDGRLNFVGNVEGREIMLHAADVIVCDGFVGNIILKLGESIASVVPQLVAQEMQRQALPPESQKMIAGVLRGVGQSFDYEEYGGTPLLGIAGNVLIGHGGSSARAVENMIIAGAEVARRNVAGAIEDVFS
ncbi:MAG: phosphate acyltransferase PlsX, partial [Rhodothermales bacterium]|nr:phosphate acyltransferase PlsX [Rhodothermales bacterium]